MVTYQIYRMILNVWLIYKREYSLNSALLGVLIGFGVWLILFVLQGIGVYTMAKKRNMKNKWLAFMPFVNLFYIGNLVGNCNVFGRKVKRLGLYAMLAQIVTAIACFGAIGSEMYLLATCNENLTFMQNNNVYYPVWTNLTGIQLILLRIYEISAFIIAIMSLLQTVTSLLLFSGLYKKYSPDNNFFLLLWTVFMPVAQYIIVFILRNRKAVDYESYMRTKQEEFIRRQQQYRNTYGNPTNPYGTYTWGAPSGNPYNQEQQKPKEKPADPFEEFSSDTSENKKGENQDDEFFH